MATPSALGQQELAALDIDATCPPGCAAIDFETLFSTACNVKALGSHAYAAHPRFEAVLVSLITPGWVWVGPPRECPTTAWRALHGVTLLAHHSAFDRAVFERLQADGVIPPDIQPQWTDTAALAAYLQAPRDLEGAARELCGLTLDKTQREGFRTAA